MKKRTKSLTLQKLEALIPRLSSDFSKLPKLEYELSTEMKGYIGEKKVDYFLDQLSGRFTILRGVCLRINGTRFQIDTLVISDNAIYIVEIKNFSGTIIFDTILNQFIRDDGEKETGYRHPITQAELQEFRLENWLQKRHLPNIPIYFFVAISDPSTIIKVKGDTEYIARIVTHGEHIPHKILQKEKEVIQSPGRTIDHHRLGKTILSECEEQDYDILGKFYVKQRNILLGVHCPNCRYLGMERKHGGWHCLKCRSISKHAHRKSLLDFLLLVKTSISNKECMHFLKIGSRNTATRILKQTLVYEKRSKRWKKT